MLLIVELSLQKLVQFKVLVINHPLLMIKTGIIGLKNKGYFHQVLES